MRATHTTLRDALMRLHMSHPPPWASGCPVWCKATSTVAVSGILKRIEGFRSGVWREWRHALLRRSQRNRLSLDRFNRPARLDIPYCRQVHPLPSNASLRHDLRREPLAEVQLVRICAGALGNRLPYRDRSFRNNRQQGPFGISAKAFSVALPAGGLDHAMLRLASVRVACTPMSRRGWRSLPAAPTLPRWYATLLSRVAMWGAISVNLRKSNVQHPIDASRHDNAGVAPVATGDRLSAWQLSVR